VKVVYTWHYIRASTISDSGSRSTSGGAGEGPGLVIVT